MKPPFQSVEDGVGIYTHVFFVLILLLFPLL